jgi:Cupin-like domain
MKCKILRSTRCTTVFKSNLKKCKTRNSNRSNSKRQQKPSTQQNTMAERKDRSIDGWTTRQKFNVNECGGLSATPANTYARTHAHIGRFGNKSFFAVQHPDHGHRQHHNIMSAPSSTCTTTPNNDTGSSGACGGASSTTTSASTCCCYADTITEMPSPRIFYETYVQKRRPVVLKGCCHHVTPRLLKVFDSSSSSSSPLDQLVTIVGHDTIIQVNESFILPTAKNSAAAAVNDTTTSTTTTTTTTTTNVSFSPRHSRIVDMKFGDFCEKLRGGQQEKNTRKQYYMTTQNLGMTEEGQPRLYTSPITELIASSGNKYMDALRPAILGNLIPMTYNLWIGSGGSGSGGSGNNNNSASSSGLHHDYHDNLYCLLQGTKQFRIAPPISVYHLKTRGTLHTLHRNGRIVYQEQIEQCGGGVGGGMMIRPDGALEKVERIMEVEMKKHEIEAQIEKLNDTTFDNRIDDDIHLKRLLLEQQLDAVDEELLDLEMGDNHHSDSDDDDDDDAHGDAAAFGASCTSDESSDEHCGKPHPKRSKKLKSSSNHDDDDHDDNQNDGDDDDRVPLNFVMEEGDCKVQFQTVNIQKGDLLYLPAGWFHEVFSQGETQHSVNDDKTNGGIHAAFNYWMHPPDVEEDSRPCTTGEMKTTISFDTPYKSQFWQRDWDSRGTETKLPFD